MHSPSSSDSSLFGRHRKLILTVLGSITAAIIITLESLSASDSITRLLCGIRNLRNDSST